MSSFTDAGRELANLLDNTSSQVEALRRRQAAAQDAGDAPPAEGSDSDGLVKAAVGADGRLVTLELDERTTSMPRAELQRAVMAAVNAALTARHAAGVDEIAGAQVDPAVLGRQLEDARNQAVQTMHRISEGLLDAMRQIEKSTRR